MPNSPAVRPTESWAEVRAHDHVMRYHRSGVGPPILVLRTHGSADGAEPLWPELLAALTLDYRLIVPDMPATGQDVAAWLTDFLEGLGLAGVGVIAADRFCIAALELALLGLDQVARVVLVADGRAGEPGLDGALATTTRAASVPLLVVRRERSTGEVLPLVTRFLAGDGAPAPG
jgi:pimeloyl-ACP methyl ester carboxylesterase